MKDLWEEKATKPDIHRSCIWCRHHVNIFGASFRHYCSKHMKIIRELQECHEFEQREVLFKTDKDIKKLVEKLHKIGEKECAMMMERLRCDRTILMQYIDRDCGTCAAFESEGYKHIDCTGCVQHSNWEWNGK